MLTVDSRRRRCDLTMKSSLVNIKHPVITTYEEALELLESTQEALKEAQQVGEDGKRKKVKIDELPVTTGFVSRVRDTGVSVTLFGNVHGIIPARELKEKGETDLVSAYPLGCSIVVRIVNVNPASRTCLFSTRLRPRAGQSESSNTVAPPLQAGTIVSGTVIRATSAQPDSEDHLTPVLIRVDVPGDDDNTQRGHICRLDPYHASDHVSWSSSLLKGLQVGQRVTGLLVLDAGNASAGQNSGLAQVPVSMPPRLPAPKSSPQAWNAYNRGLRMLPSVSLKPLLLHAALRAPQCLPNSPDALLPGHVCFGYVASVAPFGLFVRCLERFTALVYKSRVPAINADKSTPEHLSEKEELPPQLKNYRVGMSVAVVVDTVDKERGKVVCSMRPQDVLPRFRDLALSGSGTEDTGSLYLRSMLLDEARLAAAKVGEGDESDDEEEGSSDSDNEEEDSEETKDQDMNGDEEEEDEEEEGDSAEAESDGEMADNADEEDELTNTNANYRNFPVGAVVTGTVMRVEGFGVVMALPGDVVGVASAEHVPQQSYSEGQLLAARVLAVDQLEGVVEVSLLPRLVGESKKKLKEQTLPFSPKSNAKAFTCGQGSGFGGQGVYAGENISVGSRIGVRMETARSVTREGAEYAAVSFVNLRSGKSVSSASGVPAIALATLVDYGYPAGVNDRWISVKDVSMPNPKVEAAPLDNSQTFLAEVIQLPSETVEEATSSLPVVRLMPWVSLPLALGDIKAAIKGGKPQSSFDEHGKVVRGEKREKKEPKDSTPRVAADQIAIGTVLQARVARDIAAVLESGHEKEGEGWTSKSHAGCFVIPIELLGIEGKHSAVLHLSEAVSFHPLGGAPPIDVPVSMNGTPGKSKKRQKTDAQQGDFSVLHSDILSLSEGNTVNVKVVGIEEQKHKKKASGEGERKVDVRHTFYVTLRSDDLERPGPALANPRPAWDTALAVSQLKKQLAPAPSTSDGLIPLEASILHCGLAPGALAWGVVEGVDHDHVTVGLGGGVYGRIAATELGSGRSVKSMKDLWCCEAAAEDLTAMSNPTSMYKLGQQCLVAVISCHPKNKKLHLSARRARFALKAAQAGKVESPDASVSGTLAAVQYALFGQVVGTQWKSEKEELRLGWGLAPGRIIFGRVSAPPAKKSAVAADPGAVEAKLKEENGAPHGGQGAASAQAELFIRTGVVTAGRLAATEAQDPEQWADKPLGAFDLGDAVRVVVLERITASSGAVHSSQHQLSIRPSTFAWAQTKFDEAFGRAEAVKVATDKKSPKKGAAGFKAVKLEWPANECKKEAVKTLNIANAAVKKGSVVPGFIFSSSRVGVFIQLTRSLNARCLLSHLSDGYVKDIATAFPPGRLVAGKVLNTKAGKVELTLRSSDVTGKRSGAGRSMDMDSLQVNTSYSGIIRGVKPYGVFVELLHPEDEARLASEGVMGKVGSGLVGLVHHRRMDAGEEEVSRYERNDIVRVALLGKDLKKGRLDLSLKKSHVFAAEQGDAEHEVLKDADMEGEESESEGEVEDAEDVEMEEDAESGSEEEEDAGSDEEEEEGADSDEDEEEEEVEDSDEEEEESDEDMNGSKPVSLQSALSGLGGSGGWLMVRHTV